jgi:hypothetical protein
MENEKQNTEIRIYSDSDTGCGIVNGASKDKQGCCSVESSSQRFDSHLRFDLARETLFWEISINKGAFNIRNIHSRYFFGRTGRIRAVEVRPQKFRANFVQCSAEEFSD